MQRPTRTSKIKDNSHVYFGNLLPAVGEYVVDPVHSFAEFAVQHLIVGQVRGCFNSIAGIRLGLRMIRYYRLLS